MRERREKIEEKKKEYFRVSREMQEERRREEEKKRNTTDLSDEQGVVLCPAFAKTSPSVTANDRTYRQFQVQLGEYVCVHTDFRLVKSLCSRFVARIIG